jgi:uncharacterized protein YneF (UPF0154 family)
MSLLEIALAWLAVSLVIGPAMGCFIAAGHVGEDC